MCRLELDGTNAIEMAVSTDRIVEVFDVLGHVRGAVWAVRVDASPVHEMLATPERMIRLPILQQSYNLSDEAPAIRYWTGRASSALRAWSTPQKHRLTQPVRLLQIAPPARALIRSARPPPPRSDGSRSSRRSRPCGRPSSRPPRSPAAVRRRRGRARAGRRCARPRRRRPA